MKTIPFQPKYKSLKMFYYCKNVSMKFCLCVEYFDRLFCVLIIFLSVSASSCFCTSDGSLSHYVNNFIQQ